jgi:hypothetical protein
MWSTLLLANAEESRIFKGGHLIYLLVEHALAVEVHALSPPSACSIRLERARRHNLSLQRIVHPELH